MKKKFFISIVLVMLFFASTMIVAARPSNLPEQADRNGLKNNIKVCIIIDEIAFRIYQQRGWVPEGILNILVSLNGR